MDKSVGLKDALKTFYPLLILIAAIELLIWVHWNTLLDTAGLWDNPKYSHGYLVPLFAGVLLFLRRDETVPLIKSLATLGGSLLGIGLLLCVLPFVLPGSVFTLSARSVEFIEAAGVALSAAGALLVIQQRIPFSKISVAERWIGFGIIIAAEAIRLWSTRTSHYWPERFAFLPALAGVFMMVGGLRSLRWAGWPIFFLIFMLPLPQQLDGTLSANLQTQATASSTYLLQTLGVGAVRSGSVISVGHDGVPMNVEEACSGLRMLTIFVALAFAVVLVAEIPTWQSVVIALSSVPIALAVNIMRITGTGILFTIFPASQEKLRAFFHDGAGLVMMPLAMVLLFLEYKILTNLFVEDDEDLSQPLASPTTAPKLTAPKLIAPKLATPKLALAEGPLSEAPLPMRPVAPRPVATRPAAPAPLAGKPLPAKPLPARPPSDRPLSANSLPAKPLPARPLPARPLPAKPMPATPLPAGSLPTASLPTASRQAVSSSGGPIPANPIPARPLAAKPLPAKPLPVASAPVLPPVGPPTANGGSIAPKPIPANPISPKPPEPVRSGHSADNP